ncbi:MAG: hypothetical protein A2W91_18895 [Bacteroidetes bacterium GWF2_38_335]|nr:MAG: hypothetical protein A2W91_18895 [Bacteroidetes bacterium GWF2_38_335]OFY80256.1 MAG: hypothetical protein A2281_17300 [Bacteroidetes bacterium RIFOXYA12_FULL_38_20]HBS88711.1 hypothetical protein [Bacteroidales bacterium]
MKLIYTFTLLLLILALTSCNKGEYLNEPVYVYLDPEFGTDIKTEGKAIYLVDDSETYYFELIYCLSDRLNNYNIFICESPVGCDFEIEIKDFDLKEKINPEKRMDNGDELTFDLRKCKTNVTYSLYKGNNKLMHATRSDTDQEKLIYKHGDYLIEELNSAVFLQQIDRCADEISRQISRNIAAYYN